MVDLYYRTIKAADYLLNGNPDVTDERIFQCRQVRSSYTYGIKEFDDEESKFFSELI
jgi:hypothetical protein